MGHLSKIAHLTPGRDIAAAKVPNGPIVSAPTWAARHGGSGSSYHQLRLPAHTGRTTLEEDRMNPLLIIPTPARTAQGGVKFTPLPDVIIPRPHGPHPR